jgi:hypothetical protein
MRRRLILLAVATSALVAPAITHGCSNEPPFESVCDWIGDPENCFREFHEEMLAYAGPDNPNGDCRTYPPLPVSAYPTEASASAPGVSNGSFLKRAMLDTCILNAGGQVTVDPPIDLTMFPPSLYADPITYKFTFVNPDGNACGNATYTSAHGFSITINPPPDAGGTAVMDAGADVSPPPPDSGPPPEMDDGGMPIPFGTYTQVIAPGRSAFDVTCPSGETHHFNLNEVDGPPASNGVPNSSCPAYTPATPQASLQVYLGGVDFPGAVSFAIVYPPASGTNESAGFSGPDAGLLVPDRVVYFNCSIPAQSESCADAVKDGFETDIDCGGPQIPSLQNCGSCPVRCQAMQQCICDYDCNTDAGLVCGVSTTNGMRQCVDPATVDGGVGSITHFMNCAWKPDAGAPCSGPADGGH